MKTQLLIISVLSALTVKAQITNSAHSLIQSATDHGVYFDVNGINNQIAPQQGVYTGIPANDISWNNQWINNIANKVDGTVPSVFSIRWVYDVNSTIEFDPDPSATFVSRQPGNSHINCP